MTSPAASRRDASPLSLVQRSLLEKVARDNGFDIPKGAEEDWLSFASSEVRLRVWFFVDEARCYLALSEQAVADELLSLSDETQVDAPSGAVAVLATNDLQQFHRVVRRAYQLSATLPNALLTEFERATQGLPRATEVERLVIQRVGQDLFRDGLLRYWEGKCAVTGLAERELLRASHIKPWARCTTDPERLNSNNGLLLAAHLDAVFDEGFVSFQDDGTIMISDRLSLHALSTLGIHPGMKVIRLSQAHCPYLAWHRAHLFR